MKRTEALTIHLTPEELEEIKTHAKEEERKTSEYARITLIKAVRGSKHD